MKTIGFVNCKVVGLVTALALVLAVAGCTPEGATGALEEGELYNTQGLLELPLFDERGLAPPSSFSSPYVRVGFIWDAEEGCRLEGRFLFADSSWSEWYELRAHWSEGIAHAGHIDVPGAVRPEGFQLRHLAGPAPSFLLAEGIEQVGEVAEPELAPRQGLASQGQALAPASLVHPRSDWGARSPAPPAALTARPLSAPGREKTVPGHRPAFPAATCTGATSSSSVSLSSGRVAVA